MALIWDKSQEEGEEEEKEEVCNFQQTFDIRKTKLWREKVFSDNVIVVVVAVAGEVLYLTFNKKGGRSGSRKLHFKSAF